MFGKYSIPLICPNCLKFTKKVLIVPEGVSVIEHLEKLDKSGFICDRCKVKSKPKEWVDAQKKLNKVGF